MVMTLFGSFFIEEKSVKQAGGANSFNQIQELSN
jgi:hypothetical protein